MWLNSTAQYALRATMYIAEHAGTQPERVGDIAGALGGPRNYLSKTLHALVRAGVLRSGRGPRGGFQLADPPEQLSIARVVAPFAPPGERRCLVGRKECGAATACLAHYRWSKVAAAVEEFFAHTTVADLLGEVRDHPDTASAFDFESRPAPPRRARKAPLPARSKNSPGARPLPRTRNPAS